MKQLFIKIIGFFQGDVKRLSNNSAGIVDVFTKTVNDLKDVNTDIQSKIDNREKQIAKIISENESLEVLQFANKKVISKLEGILA